MAGDHVHRTLGAALGGLIGALAGLFSSLIYRRNRSIEHQLRRAIAKDKVRLAYQPIVDLATRRIIGAEALARWTDEEGFAVGPDVFVRVAEEFGFVGELTRLVVRHALRDFAEIIHDNPDFRLSINVAAADLSDPAFLPMLAVALKQAGVPAQNLAIEITESSTARHQMAKEAIRGLRQRGHSVHVDDFGTGYSSLSYLQDLSIDTIKIDRSFTQTIGTQAVTVGILPQILAMAAVLNLGVIVEGVETSQQASYFAGVDSTIQAQGWLFGRPVPVSEFLNLLNSDHKEQAVFEDAPEQGTSPMPLQVA
jgi:sensor c-di-GMP phosphodiesterase-like protein